RKYTTDYYKEKIDKIKKALPGLAITSDVIVGFPGETEEEYMETYNFIREIGYSELHVFPYSQRTGTPAARMDDQVANDVKNRRVARMIDLSDQLAKEYASQYEGHILEVIPEEVHAERDGAVVGYTDNYMKVILQGEEDLIGQLIRVKITKAGYPYNEGVFVKIVDNATNK